MKRAVAALVCVFSAGCSGAPGATGDGAGSCTLAVEWGVGADGSFVKLGDGDQAPVSTDAQGAGFIDSTLRLTGTSAAEATLDATATADGYQPDERLALPLQLSAGIDGSRYASGLHVPFDALPSQDMPGRRAMVMLVAHASGCTAWTAATVQLVRR